MASSLSSAWPRPVRSPAAAAAGAVLAGVTIVTALAVILAAGGCPGRRTGSGPAAGGTRGLKPEDIRLPPGYEAEVVADGLTAPSCLAFDSGGQLYVGESGMGGNGPARVLRIKSDGAREVVARDFGPPLLGIAFLRDTLYVSHRGRISAVGDDGTISDIVTGLPSFGDYGNQKLAVGPDGRLYFGQGTATNAAVVGPDNMTRGWPATAPFVADCPCRDIKLAGETFSSENPLTATPSDHAVTGAYSPFGTAGFPGQIIPGRVPCNGAVLSINPDGSGPAAFAWGLRLPTGLAFDSQGRLFVTEQGFEPRGSRPVAGDEDDLYLVQRDAWLGWPDFAGGRPVTDEAFAPEGGAPPKFVLQEHPVDEPPAPLARLGPGTGAGGMAFCPGGVFGFGGDLFIAAAGSPPTLPGGSETDTGGQVLRVDMAANQVSEFAVNVRPGPASIGGCGGLERPVDVAFGPEGALYVVDGGVISAKDDVAQPVAGTGVVWRIRYHNTEAVVTVGAETGRRVGTQAWPRRVGGGVLFMLLVLVAGSLAARRRGANPG